MMHLLLLCANIKHTMKIILFDDKSWGTLRPLTFTRPISELRVGILTIREKWEKRFGDKVAYLTKDYLQEKFPLSVEDDNLLINSSVCPNDELVYLILHVKNTRESLPVLFILTICFL